MNYCHELTKYRWKRNTKYEFLNDLISVPDPEFNSRHQISDSNIFWNFFYKSGILGFFAPNFVHFTLPNNYLSIGGVNLFDMHEEHHHIRTIKNSTRK